MSGGTIKKYLRVFDLHDDRSIRWAIIACLILLGILTIYVRTGLVHYKTGDYQAFSGWYDFIKLHGLHSFKYNFSNYNPPFTYLLYIATILPLSKIVAIKWMLALFDVVLAVSVYFLVKIFRPNGYIALIAAISSLYVPTVLITGVFFSQFDQLYTAFVIFSLYFGLKKMSRLAWIFFAVAFAIKFQAIFFLPVLAIMSFKRINWYDIFWGAAAFLIVSLPPVIVGRSAISILNIYPQQTSQFNHYLTANAPNMYQWVPNSTFAYFDHMGIGLGIAVSLLVILVTLIYKKFSMREILLATTLLLYAVPFFLPAMHERYFFPAGIASLVLAFAYPTVKHATLAVIAQLVTFFSYCPFLFSTEPIPFSILSIFILLIICVMAAEFLKIPKDLEPTTKRLA